MGAANEAAAEIQKQLDLATFDGRCRAAHAHLRARVLGVASNVDGLPHVHAVSRTAGPPSTGHVVLRKPSWKRSGDSPVGRNSTSSGAKTGS